MRSDHRLLGNGSGVMSLGSTRLKATQSYSTRVGCCTRGHCEMSEVGAEAPAEGTDTIFGKITRKEIPATILHEDDLCMAIVDINGVAPVHFLVLPKKPLQRLSKSSVEDKALLGHLLYVAQDVAKKQSLAGFRVVINDGKEGCQSVYHLHIHVIGGRTLSWPPG